MKKVILLCVCMVCMLTSKSISQEIVLYNGETTGQGMWEQFVFESEEVNNEWKDAVNSTEKCMRVIRPKNTWEIWGGAICHAINVPNITDYGKLTMMVKKEVAGKVRLEIQTAGETKKEFPESYYSADALNQWQKLEFKLRANALDGEAMTTALISIHFEETENDDDFIDQYMYFDEIILVPKTTSADYNGESLGIGMWNDFLISVAEVTNPQKDTKNPSEKCLQIFRIKDSEPHAGALAEGFKYTALTNCEKITLLVKKDVPGTVQLELQTKDEAFKEHLTAEYSADHSGEWQKLEFIVPENALSGNPLEKILLMPHLADTRDDATYTDQYMYVDELMFVEKGSTGMFIPGFDSSQIVQSTLYSITGKLLKTGTKDEIINGSTLPKGIYILKQIDANGNKTSKKIVN